MKVLAGLSAACALFALFAWARWGIRWSPFTLLPGGVVFAFWFLLSVVAALAFWRATDSEDPGT